MKFQDPGSWKTTRMTHGSGISFAGSLFDCEFTWCRNSEMVRRCLKTLIRRYGSYCWWKKSCTTWDVKNPVNNGIFTISNWCRIPSINSRECHGFCFRKKPLLLGGNWWKPKWFGTVPDRIYVWYIYIIYLPTWMVEFYGRYRFINLPVPWILWVVHVQGPGNESWMFKQVIWKTTPVGSSSKWPWPKKTHKNTWSNRDHCNTKSFKPGKLLNVTCKKIDNKTLRSWNMFRIWAGENHLPLMISAS